jgi:mono/diheme cytochrome c family protein
MLRSFAVALAALAAGLVCFARAGDGFKPGKLTKEEIAKLQPGLTLRFLAEGDAGLTVDARRIRLAALHVPAGAAPSTMLPAGRFRATLSGLLKLPLKGEYAFKLFGTGDATLALNNKTVVTLKAGESKPSEPVELAKGYNKIEVKYTSPEKAGGDATLRVYWSGEGFGWEPVPPDALSSRGDDADLRAGLDLREGRLLFATHGCARCHGMPGKLQAADCPMPELAQQGPSLANAGHRFRADWLAAWIADPHALRPEATMPRVLTGDVGPQAADLASYLASLKVGKPLPASSQDDKLTRDGEKHFLKLGCITCHSLQQPSKKDDYNRQSLYYAAAKFAPGALEAFLKAPHQHYPWIRMPDFKLTGPEAAALTSYLLSATKGKVDAGKGPVGDAGRGAKLFASAGCAQCHATDPDAAAPKPSVAFPKIPVKGCLAEDASARGKAPDFVFTNAQRLALRVFLATDGGSLTRETSAEFSLRQMKLLQCNACHTRDGAPSRWYTVLIEEGGGVQPEYLPHLTWTGEKLHPEWTEKLLAGTHDHRARPWLKARMPAFPARARVLAPGLSHEHGFAVAEDPRPKPDAKLAALGEKLLPQVAGFNCVQCHAVGDQKAVAPFEAEGINLVDAAVRLRYEYFARWLLDPTRVDPTTRMTKFTMDGKTTALTDVLDGDARRQFDALWHYIQTLPGKKR